VLDGTRIRDVPSFITELERAVQDVSGARTDFGWDLHSFRDHLFGGYGGSPPYEIIVKNADGMVAAMDHAGMVEFCNDMLKVVAAGGRGFVQATDRDWYETQRANARRGQGDTLLDLLFEFVSDAPAELTLVSSSGALLASSKDRPRG